MQGAARESDMPVQEKAGGKAHAKSNENGSSPGRDGREAQMDIVLMQDVVEAEPVHRDVQHGACPAARRIPKGLQGHDPAKGRIKEINKGGDIVFQLLYHHINFPWSLSQQRYRQKVLPPNMCGRYAVGKLAYRPQCAND